MSWKKSLPRCEGRTYFAHRIVLCLTSEYFEKLLDGGMVESTMSCVRLQLPADTVEPVLRFLYAGGDSPVELDQALEMLVAADMLQLPALARQCDRLQEEASFEGFLKSNIKP